MLRRHPARQAVLNLEALNRLGQRLPYAVDSRPSQVQYAYTEGRPRKGGSLADTKLGPDRRGSEP
jgi:hypothetical protein